MNFDVTNKSLKKKLPIRDLHVEGDCLFLRPPVLLLLGAGLPRLFPPERLLDLL
jgi:hypothetical protein